jgi:hypothetical protein
MNSKREQRGHVDTAYAIAWANENSHIALLTPVGTPRVLDDPILLFGLGISSIAYKKNCMIKVWRASLIIIYNSSLILEPL